MTLTSAPAPTAPVRLDPAGAVLLAVGGLAFFVSGPLHPQGSDHGDKTEQLHSMLVDSMWYPAHAIGLLGFACIAAALVALRRQPELRGRLGKALTVATVLALVGTVGAMIHLLAGTQAAGLEDGGMTPLAGLFMGVETLVNPLWGLSLAALAATGGATRALGGRVVAALGVVGGVAFALATATIAFTDLLDPLFPVAGLLGLWAVAVGVIGALRRRV